MSLVEHGSIQANSCRSALCLALSSRVKNYSQGDNHIQLPVSPAIEYSVPSLLISHGANIYEPLINPRKFSYQVTPNPSYLKYLLPLPGPFAHIRTEFVAHLDPNGISELSTLDRWLCSILFYTSPEFKRSLLSILGVNDRNVLALGMLSLDNLASLVDLARKEYQEDANEYNLSPESSERRLFLSIICESGTKDMLDPFLGGHRNMAMQYLEEPDSSADDDLSSFNYNHLSFENENTFESLAAAGIRIMHFKTALQVLSSRLIRNRLKNKQSLAPYFDLWSPCSRLRPLVLAYWLWHLQKENKYFEVAHHQVVDVLIDRDFCSFRGLDSSLGIEVIWQVCAVIGVRENPAWHQMRFWLRMSRMSLLMHLLDQHQAFVDLELCSSWIPPRSSYYMKTPEFAPLIGFTPLMLAILAGDLELITLLVKKKANIKKLHSSRKISALDLAFQNLSCYHPRNWAGLPMSEIRFIPNKDNWLVSEETDKAIYTFLVKSSSDWQNLALVPLPEPKARGKLILSSER